MTKSLILLLFIVTGCAPPVEVESETDMHNPPVFKQYEWGQTKIVQPADWQRDKPISIVTKDAEFADRYAGVKRPFTKNVTLAATYDPQINSDFALHWLVIFGVGGGNASFEIDANSLQQFTISADTLRISAVTRYIGIVDANGNPIGADPPFAYDNPSRPIELNVFYAEGTTSTDPPTLTQRFILDGSGGAAPSVTVPVPKFASSFRILGNPYSAGSPFTNNQLYDLETSTGGASLDTFRGDELLGIRLAPIPTGEAQVLFMRNSDVGGITGSIEWELDL
jgi:hypothetical protein